MSFAGWVESSKFLISKIDSSFVLVLNSLLNGGLTFSDILYGNRPRLRSLGISNIVVLLFMCVVLFGSCVLGSHRKVRITVIAPEKSSQDDEVLGAILPAVDLAIKAVANPIYGHLPNYDIEYRYRNSKCSPTYGPLAAIELHNISGK